MMLLFTAMLAALGAPSDVESAVMNELRMRDGFVGCEAVYALGDASAVWAALLAATDIPEPAWVPMRAAQCVVERMGDDPVAEEHARSWLVDPDKPGFALMVVRGLDALSEERALPFAELAAKRMESDARFSRHARPVMEASVHARVRALVRKETMP